MTLQVDFWQLLGFGLTLLSGFAGIIFGAGRLIASQFQSRIDERFVGQPYRHGWGLVMDPEMPIEEAQVEGEQEEPAGQ